MRDPSGMAFVCVLVLACGSGNESCNIIPSEPGPTPPDATHGSMTATVNGVTWTLQVWSAPNRCGPTCLSFVARRDYYKAEGQIAFGLAGFDPGGTSTVSLGSDGTSTAAVMISSSLWESRLPGGSGALTLNTLTETGASGTFSFIAMPSPGTGATGTKQVTSGSFTLIF